MYAKEWVADICNAVAGYIPSTYLSGCTHRYPPDGPFTHFH